MADRILLNSENKIWKNTNDIIIKDRPFNESVLQDGLIFWGKADVNLLTLVDGYVSEAYDVRDGYGGARKMVQTSASLRPRFNGDRLLGENITRYLESTSNQNAIKSMFIVCRVSITSGAFFGIGNGDGGSEANWRYLGKALSGSSNFKYVHRKNAIGDAGSQIYRYNNTNVTSGLLDTNIKILQTIVDVQFRNVLMKLGTLYTSGGTYWEIFEWGWYNRILTSKEIQYNENSLNTIYKAF